jgi:L,D-peptidoglycan transpeptidase YkuD (ErfK/YbiS/YcfS/YnhG family)
MIIYLKKKNILKIDDFYFKCTIGKNGLSKKKIEGDKKTPIGLFKLENLYYRSERIKKPITKLKLVKINKNMCWCDDIKDKKNYNRFSRKILKSKHEKLFRKDDKYDLLIPIKFNFEKPEIGKGSCIFIHITKNYKPTAGCIAVSKKDFLIISKIINSKTKINIS